MRIRRSILLTVCLVLILAFSIVGTVNSQNDQKNRVEASYYYELEQQYVKDMKEVLLTEGYRNSGVMITRTIDEDGYKTYQISIHNSRFERLTDEEKDNLLWMLREKAFEADDCSFIHKLV